MQIASEETLIFVIFMLIDFYEILAYERYISGYIREISEKNLTGNWVSLSGRVTM